LGRFSNGLLGRRGWAGTRLRSGTQNGSVRAARRLPDWDDGQDHPPRWRLADSLSYYVIASVTWDGMPDSTFTLPEAVRATLRGDRAKG